TEHRHLRPITYIIAGEPSIDFNGPACKSSREFFRLLQNLIDAVVGRRSATQRISADVVADVIHVGGLNLDAFVLHYLDEPARVVIMSVCAYCRPEFGRFPSEHKVDDDLSGVT